MILTVVKEILKLISGMNWIMKPRKGVAWGKKSTFLSLSKIVLSLLSIFSMAPVRSYTLN